MVVAGKDDVMKKKRIVSIGTNSMIYHKPGCRYVNHIKPENRLFVSEQEAKFEGYHICKYCNCMNHHYQTEWETLDFYSKSKGMQFNYIDGILYVKSEIGCWKLVYVRKEEKIVLYHRSATTKSLDFNNPQYEPYHRQADVPYSNSIKVCLEYIYEHDKYKAALGRGEKITKFSSKKYERYAAKAEIKRQRNRVDYLFRTIERQNIGYKELSYC